MDFPDVSLVVQAGLPVDSDVYTHRVGRTARAGKDGRAVIMLTEAESFFLKVNPQLHIEPHSETTQILKDATASSKASQIMASIDQDIKRRAYLAYLGFMKSFMEQMKLTPGEVVQMANKIAIEGMGCPEVPEMEKRVAG